MRTDMMPQHDDSADSILTEEQWAALEAAEKPLYPPHSGCFALTDVMPREESGMAADLWRYAEESAENTIEEEYGSDDFSQAVQMETARRVADAIACLAFGREFIDAPALEQEGAQA